jgi:hypothetical protein
MDRAGPAGGPLARFAPRGSADSSVRSRRSAIRSPLADWQRSAAAPAFCVSESAPAPQRTHTGLPSQRWRSRCRATGPCTDERGARCAFWSGSVVRRRASASRASRSRAASYAREREEDAGANAKLGEVSSTAYRKEGMPESLAPVNAWLTTARSAPKQATSSPSSRTNTAPLDASFSDRVPEGTGVMGLAYLARSWPLGNPARPTLLMLLAGERSARAFDRWPRRPARRARHDRSSPGRGTPR